MEIFVNSKRIKVNDFDSPETVLKLYCLKISNTTDGIFYNTLKIIPNFLKFEPKNPILVNQKKYFVNNVISDVSKIKEIELLQPKLNFISTEYRLNKYDIGIIWLITQDYYNPVLKEFIPVYQKNKDIIIKINSNFSTPKLCWDALTKFIKQTNDLSGALKLEIDKDENYYNIITKVKNIPTVDNFEPDEVNENFFLDLPDGETMYEIFDNFRVSLEIPFIGLYDNSYLSYETRNNKTKNCIFKIYQDIPYIPESWVNDYNFDLNTKTNDIVLIIYILNSSLDKLYNPDIQLETLYNVGEWDQNNVLKLKLNMQGKDAIFKIKETIFSSLKSITINEVQSTQTKIKGTFLLHNITINKAVFSYLVMNDDVFSYFLYLDERDKTILEKDRFVFYYQKSHPKIFTNSLTLTVTIKESSTEIRVSRASSLQQINNFMKIFQMLCGLYLEKYDSVVDYYVNLFPNAKSYIDKYSPKKRNNQKENKKTGARLLALQKHKPDAFGKVGEDKGLNKQQKKKTYSGVCFKERQPYVFDENELNNVKNKLAQIPDVGPDLSEYGVMNWPKGSRDWYACYPRDNPNDKHLYPGLKKQDILAKNYEKYPALPCCYITNQYKKDKGTLKVFPVEKKTNYTIENSNVVEGSSFDRPLGPNKLLPRGKYGELPLFIQIAMATMYSSKIQIKNKSVFPILRLGVIESQYSFLHCFETAFNPKYRKMSVQEKEKQINIILDDITILEDDDFVSCRQELYDYSYDEIRTHLITEGAYIDPDLYVNFFAKLYKCNVFLFQVNSENPNGEIVIPRHAIVHLDYKINKKLRTIIIVKFESEREWHYQSELIVKYDNKAEDSDKIKYYFEYEPLIDIIYNIFQEGNKVYMMSPDGRYAHYKPEVVRGT